MLGLLLVSSGIVLWLAPFIPAKRGTGQLVAVDRRSRLGLLLEVVGLSLMLQSRFWQVSEFSWRVAIAAILLLMAALLSWTATRALGRQLRFDAAIGTEHQLVRNGPYAVIRHPIYCSMLCLLWGIGALAAPAWLFLLATAIFLAGTEIRVRVEDRLLAQHFQGTFEQYRQSTRAYVPWIR